MGRPCRRLRRGLKAEGSPPPPPMAVMLPLKADGEGAACKITVQSLPQPLDPPMAKISTLWVILGPIMCKLLCTRPNSFCTIPCFTHASVHGESVLWRHWALLRGMTSPVSRGKAHMSVVV